LKRVCFTTEARRIQLVVSALSIALTLIGWELGNPTLSLTRWKLGNPTMLLTRGCLQRSTNPTTNQGNLSWEELATEIDFTSPSPVLLSSSIDRRGQGLPTSFTEWRWITFKSGRAPPVATSANHCVHSKKKCTFKNEPHSSKQRICHRTKQTLISSP
jgi:hypothetical protein